MIRRSYGPISSMAACQARQVIELELSKMSKIDEPNCSNKCDRTRRNLLALGAIAAAAVMSGCRVDGRNSSHDDERQRHNHQCFLRGTKVLTAGGERKVEDLSQGDLLVTLTGDLRRIQWVGRYHRKRTISGRPWDKNALPVRVARSALAPNIPHRDLYLTPGHAIFIEGSLVSIGSLVNGKTISVYPAAEFEELEFFHIRLETHDVIYAEGATCETLLTVTESAGNYNDFFCNFGIPNIEEQPFAPILS